MAALLLAACASRAAGETQGNELAMITVTNDLRPQSLVTVRIATAGGSRRILGSVPPESTRRFSLSEPTLVGQYRLLAEAADGRTAESRDFNLFVGADARWSLFNNSLVIGTM